jgi:uncharacterized repeat protein (TIGR03803 family)
MTSLRTLTPTARALAIALGLAGPISMAHAVLPSAEAVVNFTAALPAGGNGARPSTPLTEAADGYLYSRTATGGGTVLNSQQGGNSAVFFRLKNDATGFEVLDSGASTVAPTSTRWLAASDGHLYSPGPSSGLIQRYRHGATTGWETFHTGSSGFVTSILEADLQFYLTAGASTLASLSLDGTQAIPLYTITNPTLEGGTPHYMVRGSDGRLYGLHTTGGSGFAGTLFRMDRDGNGYQVLQNFNALTTGYQKINAVRPLVEAGDGKLYGITYDGGGGDVSGGAIYRINKDGSDFELIHGFASNTDRAGYNPNTVLLGRDGHIYVSTLNGGANGGGTIVRYRIDDGVLELLYTFEALTGPAQNNIWTNPTSGATATVNAAINGGGNAAGRTPYHLMQASNGQFYGVAQRGGSHGWGSVFRFDPGDEVAAGSMLNDVPAELLNFGINVAHDPSATLALGQSVNLWWNTKGVASCAGTSTEPGSTWIGRQSAKATSSTTAASVKPGRAGTWTYTLTCQPQNPAYPPVSAAVSLTVVPTVADGIDVGNGGGGGALAWLLLPLMGLALWARRARRHP